MLEDSEMNGTQELDANPGAPGVTESAEAVADAGGAATDAGFEDDVENEDRVDPELMKLYEESMMDLEEGEIVRGTILKVDEKEVLVDVGFKSEGVIAIEEFGDLESIKVGDQVDVFLEKMENQDGLVVLSKKRADFVKVWDSVKEAADAGNVVEGRLLRKIKGGVVVDLFGVEAFLPGSQIALRQVQNVDELLGRTMKFKIIKLNKRRRNIVVSRRLMLEEEREEQKAKVLSELEKDQIREGVVKNITDFGAFVDLGGIDGLLHITDMSWGRISHPSEVVAISDKVTVKVLNFDRERERISLGLKQLMPYPWEDVDKKYAVGDRVKGRVVSITDYGAFVELEKGVEGLVHVSEMSWTKHIRHPSKIVAVGDTVEAVVLRVDKDNEKISLGLKQIEPDPWLTLEERYPVGSHISGKVRNLTNFGAFVELEEGIDGLVHISDMSWTRRIGHPSEVLKKGETVEVVILSVDKDARRVSLGLKQVSEDPWPTIAGKYSQDTVCTGKIVRLLDKGVVVDLGEELEGFVPMSQLGVENIKKPSEAFSEGDEIPLKATRVDIPNHRIVLSVKAYMGAQDQAIIDEYRTKHAPEPSTIGDVASDAVKEAGEAPAKEEAAPGAGEAPAAPHEEGGTAGPSAQEPAQGGEGAAEEPHEAKPATADDTESGDATDAGAAAVTDDAMPGAGEAGEAPAKEEAAPGGADDAPAKEEAAPGGTDDAAAKEEASPGGTDDAAVKEEAAPGACEAAQEPGRSTVEQGEAASPDEPKTAQTAPPPGEAGGVAEAGEAVPRGESSAGAGQDTGAGEADGPGSAGGPIPEQKDESKPL